MKLVCGTCGSDVDAHIHQSRSLRDSRGTVMPYRCSNPECVMSDPSKVTLGWTIGTLEVTDE